jgi:DNA repair protein RadA
MEETRKMRHDLQIDTFTEVEATLRTRLKKAGFNSITDLAIRGPADIARLINIEINDAISISNLAAVKLEDCGIIAGISSIDSNDYRRSCVNRFYIKTGSNEFDRLFGGNGIETQAVTQFYGPSATGKTQLCHTLCVTVQQLQPEYKSIYIDTENTFRAKRIAQVANAKGLDQTRVLKHVRCIQPINSARLESVLQDVCPLQLSNDGNIKLLIIDSIINPYRAEYPGRSMLSLRQSRLSKIMYSLQNVARTYDIAVVITNQVQTAVDGFSSCLADSDKPMGGNVMAHTSTFIIRLKGRPSHLIAEMKSSPCYPEASVSFGIDEGGIKDIPHGHAD